MRLASEGSSAGAGQDDVSIVIVSYFTGPVLARSLASARRQDRACEIILVDNGNEDGAVEAAIAASDVASAAPVRVLAGHGNIGFAAACNKGATIASGSILLFLNPDATLPEGALSRLVADGERQRRPWLVGAKIVDPDGAEQRGSRRETLTPWRAFVETTKLYKLAPKHPYFRRFNLHGDPCPDKIFPTPTISGACFCLPREDYFAIGGMDEGYFLHVEDVDFCLRFGKAGGGVYFDPAVAVPHVKSSSAADPSFIDYHKTKGMLRYFRAHFSDPYPAPFLWLVHAALWSAFGARSVIRRLANKPIEKLQRTNSIRADQSPR